VKSFFLAMTFLLQASAATALNSDLVTRELESLVADPAERDAKGGVATYYASRFEWRRTSSGEPYNPFMLTAAHATLPLGSVVLVEDPATSKTVVVRINDRCHSRHSSSNLIDLSRMAAQQIGIWGKGTRRVVISMAEPWHSEDHLLLRNLVE